LGARTIARETKSAPQAAVTMKTTAAMTPWLTVETIARD
jgi:hypothetical protein